MAKEIPSGGKPSERPDQSMIGSSGPVKKVQIKKLTQPSPKKDGSIVFQAELTNGSSTTYTREAQKVLADISQYLDDPSSLNKGIYASQDYMEKLIVAFEKAGVLKNAPELEKKLNARNKLSTAIKDISQIQQEPVFAENAQKQSDTSAERDSDAIDFKSLSEEERNKLIDGALLQSLYDQDGNEDTAKAKTRLVTKLLPQIRFIFSNPELTRDAVMQELVSQQNKVAMHKLYSKFLGDVKESKTTSINNYLNSETGGQIKNNLDLFFVQVLNHVFGQITRQQKKGKQADQKLIQYELEIYQRSSNLLKSIASRLSTEEKEALFATK